MGIKRYELSDSQWAEIEQMLPSKATDRERTALDNRLFVNGCLWVLRSGAHWHDLPKRYGKWKSVHRRLSHWCHKGVWERVFEMLTKDWDNSYLLGKWPQHWSPMDFLGSYWIGKAMPTGENSG